MSAAADASASPRDAPENGLVCPSCRALNLANAIVCTGCGAKLAQVPAGLTRLEAIAREEAAAHNAALQEQAAKRIGREAVAGRQHFVRQIAALLAVALLLFVLAVLALRLHAGQVQQRAARLAAEYQRAQGCLAAQQYTCARDQLTSLLADDPVYPQAQSALDAAQLGLAGQHAAAGQWQQALDDLDSILERTPGDQRALSLEYDVYNRWITDAAGHGDAATVLRVTLQRNARFPQRAPPTN